VDYEKVTNIGHFLPKCCNYENRIIYDPIKRYEIAYKSLEEMAESIKV